MIFSRNVTSIIYLPTNHLNCYIYNMKSSFLKANLKNPYYFILVSAFIYFFYLLISMPEAGTIWKFFWDVNDYRLQSESSLLSKDFYFPSPKKWFSPRPFTMSLMYKFVNSDTYRMIWFQKYFYLLSVAVLILTLNSCIKNYVIKIISSVFLLFFFSWWNILGWSNNALSEFISVSFMFLWIASIIWYYKKKSILSVLALSVISLLFSFTRDSWPYVILAFFSLNFIVQLVLDKKMNFKSLLLLVFFIPVFMFQSYTMKVGERNVLPMFNSLVIRVSQNSNYLDWFEKQGMPDKKIIVTNFKGIDITSNEGMTKIYRSYEDTTYAKLFKWIKTNGKIVFQKFLICHPSYLFMCDQTTEQVNRIYAYNVERYYNKPDGFFLNAHNFFPVFNNFLFHVLMMACFVLFYKTKKELFLVPILIGFFMIMNVLITYNADTLEVERHLYFTVILRELLCSLSVLFITDYFINRQNRINTI